MINNSVMLKFPRQIWCSPAHSHTSEQHSRWGNPSPKNNSAADRFA